MSFNTSICQYLDGIDGRNECEVHFYALFVKIFDFENRLSPLRAERRKCLKSNKVSKIHNSLVFQSICI